MKNSIFIILLIFSVQLTAQNEVERKKVMVRVYNLEGKKISKGKFQSISETSLELIRYGQPIIIPADRIGYIKKTRHSAVRSILIGSATGAVLSGIIGEMTIKEYHGDYLFSSSDLKGLAVTAGLICGAGVGALVHPWKKSKRFYINGDIEKLKALTYHKESN